MQKNDLPLSDSVTQARDKFPADELIDAAALVQAVLSLSGHGKEYAGGLLASLSLEKTPTEMTAQTWIEEVQTLFDHSKISTLSNTKNSPILHGRLLIAGLCLLEPDLYRQVEQAGAFSALVSQIKELFADILSPRGQALYGILLPVESVPNWPDDPLEDPAGDRLGRGAFARFLAQRIKQVLETSGAYAFHLYGAWGSGKSSLLYLLQSELIKKENQETSPWLVVKYNAWRNQHIDPPWWSLMDAIYKGVKRNLHPLDRSKEFIWRLFSGRTAFVFSIVVMAWVIAIAGLFLQRNIIDPMLSQGEQPLKIISSIAGVFGNVGSILAFIVTIWGYIVANNNSLLLGSSGAAKCYQERVRDPMNEIKVRFDTLVTRLLPQRVAVFIDDLDRCRSDYVVELLEGVQTLFRDAPVVFVVAADRRWLNACYEQVYTDLKNQIQRPGKSLGMLFLEKAFRFTTPLPGISTALKEAYWNYLLLPADENRIDMEQARSIAREQVGGSRQVADLQDLIEQGEERSFAEQQALREEVAVRLANPELRENLEHVLEPYAPLMDQNPRAMKRLVNAYSANLALAILSEIKIDRHQLVLWTILSARWPELALELEDAAEKSAWFRKKNPDAPDIYQDPEILKVVNGGKIGPPLTQDTILKCKQMHA